MSYRDLFHRLNSEGIEYVVLRRYDDLPENTIDDGDVDVLIESEQYQSAVEVCRSVGFSERDSANLRFRLYRNALSKPGKALRVLAQEPRDSVQKILRGTPRQFGNPRHENTKLYRGSQMLDMQDNLAYDSPLNGSKIPVDPSVTAGMLARREKQSCFYTPAPADELAHIISHCVFDERGEFSPYYVDRSEQLFRTVRSDETQLQLFKDLLERIFFDADQLVFDLVADNRYSDLRAQLRKFSDY